MYRFLFGFGNIKLDLYISHNIESIIYFQDNFSRTIKFVVIFVLSAKKIQRNSKVFIILFLKSFFQKYLNFFITFNK